MSDAVRVYSSERCNYKLILHVDADLPQLSEEERDKISAKLQASMDRLIRCAIYGEPRSSIEQSKGEVR